MLGLSSLPPLDGHADYLAWTESAGLAVAALGATLALLARAVGRRRPIDFHVITHLVNALRACEKTLTPRDAFEYEAPGHRVGRALDDLERALIVFADQRFTAGRSSAQPTLREEVRKTTGALHTHQRAVLTGGSVEELRALLLTLLKRWSDGNYAAPAEARADNLIEPDELDGVAPRRRQLVHFLAPRTALLLGFVLVSWLLMVMGISGVLRNLTNSMASLLALLMFYDGIAKLRTADVLAGTVPGRPAGAACGTGDTTTTLLPQQAEPLGGRRDGSDAITHRAREGSPRR
jgi:hypothetical protein